LCVLAANASCEVVLGAHRVVRLWLSSLLHIFCVQPGLRCLSSGPPDGHGVSGPRSDEPRRAVATSRTKAVSTSCKRPLADGLQPRIREKSFCASISVTSAHRNSVLGSPGETVTCQTASASSSGRGALPDCQ
jgi:hypothetical protein